MVYEPESIRNMKDAVITVLLYDYLKYAIVIGPTRVT